MKADPQAKTLAFSRAKYHAAIVVEFAHANDKSLTLNRRIEIYRALAGTTTDEALAKHFHECADDLAAAENKIGQLVLAFKP